jgi:hypothetical protein
MIDERFRVEGSFTGWIVARSSDLQTQQLRYCALALFPARQRALAVEFASKHDADVYQAGGTIALQVYVDV